MMKSICIEMLGLEVDFYERIALAKSHGFDMVEFWGWEGKDIPRIASLCQTHGVSVSSISGDGPYSLCDDSHMAEYIRYAEQSMLVAKQLGCPVCVIHSNALGEGGVVLDHYTQFSRTRLFMNMLRTLSQLAPIAEKHGIVLTLEALNTSYDHQGNALYTTADSVELVRLVDSPFVKVLYDVYHMQITEGDILNTITRFIADIGHVHIADVPGRHEPGTGEINYPAVWQCLRDNGWKGAVGFELSAAGTFEDAVRAIGAL